MRLRCLPPVAAPSTLGDICAAWVAALRPDRALCAAARDMREVLGVEHVWLVSSGRAALTLVLRGLRRLSPRRRVIVPAYTCFSVPAAVVRAELDLVPCDIDPETLDFDFGRLGRLQSEAPALCVVSTHMFGLPADVERARRSCGADGTILVEDAAQAFGFVREGHWLGTLGDVGFFSFGRGKTVGAGGGGAVVSNCARIAAALDEEYRALPVPAPASALARLGEVALTSAFIRPWLYGIPARLPFLGLGETTYSTSFTIERLSGVQAGLLRSWRQRAPRLNEDRAAKAARLAARLGQTLYKGGPCLRLPVLCRSREHRDRLYAKGREAGLGFSVMYPSAVSGIAEIAADLGETRYQNAEGVAECLLTVPVHSLVSTRDLEAIERLLSEELLLVEC